MSYKKPEHLVQESTERVKKLIDERGHVFTSGEYRNRTAPLVVYCPKHNEQVVTTFYNYERSRTGLKCCGKVQTSGKLMFRTYTEETIKRMSIGALNRPKRNGKPRKWRKHHAYVQWKKEVAKSYDNKCAVTGLSSTDSVQLVAHHLNGVNNYPHLTYNVKNGILICKDIHVRFHNAYSYHKNNIDQFLEFLVLLLIEQSRKSMLISSQATPEGVEGSETRVYDPVRVMELHERLEGIRLELLAIPTEQVVLDPNLGPIDDSDSESDSE
jgi:hypothetical protein